MGITAKLRKYRVKKPRMVRREAKRAGLPLHLALAMLEKETGIPQKNIFGCDWGIGAAFCHLRVTRERVKELIRSGRANGVGWTQLTYQAFVLLAERLGGAHRPRIQCRVGFKVLADNMRREGSNLEGFRAYNGSGPAAYAYARDAMSKASVWAARLR